MQTFTGKEYLKIDIASNYGLDKADWDDRIAWFDQNEHQLENMVVQADEPALFYAGLKAYRDVQAGKPIGYMVRLDATSSGLQILACLTGDRSAAELCNVTDTGHRRNAYKLVHDYMIQASGQGANIELDDLKQAIMTSLYGSLAEPKRVFGEGPTLDLFYQSMEDLAPGAWELNTAMRTIWNPDALSHDWVMPDNFHVHTKVMDTVKETVHVEGMPFEVSYKVNQPMEDGRSLCANMTHSIDSLIVREITRRCDYDPIQVEYLREVIEQPELFNNLTRTESDKLVTILWNSYQESGYLSARILDHLNLDNLGHVDRSVIREMLQNLPERPFKVVSIHDCFCALPHYCNDLRHQYNTQLTLIARSNLLEYLISQIIGSPVQIDKLDRTLYRDVLQANYALS